MLMIAGRWTIHYYKMQTSEKYFDYHQFTVYDIIPWDINRIFVYITYSRIVVGYVWIYNYYIMNYIVL